MKRFAIRAPYTWARLDKMRRLFNWLRSFFASPRARWLVLGLFVTQAIVLAVVVQPGTPPDELNHIKFIEFYANHSLSPIFNHQQPTYNLGDKTREVDYLYHYLLSLVYRVLPLAAGAKYIVLRLFSIALGVATFFTIGAVARRLHLSEAATTVGLLVLTNLPMVLMMSAAINNDAPVWLGVALAMLLLLRLWEKPSWPDLLLLAEIIVVGGLVKRTMLPFNIIFAVLGLIIFLRAYRSLVRWPRHIDWRIVAVVVVLLVSTGLAVERIGGNLLRYHNPSPSCEQVQGVAPCSVFWANVRSRNQAALATQPMIPIPLFAIFWFATSLFNIVDIQTQGWHHEVMPASWLPWLLGIMLCAGIIYGLYCDARSFRLDVNARHRVYITV